MKKIDKDAFETIVIVAVVLAQFIAVVFITFSIEECLNITCF